MSMLEQLRPFVSFCQGTGWIPFTVSRNDTKNSFNFTFSFKNWTTRWFIVICFFQIVILFVMASSFTGAMADLFIGKEIPITISFLGLVSGVGNFITFILTRWIILRRYRSLNNAYKLIQDIQPRLEPNHYRHQSTLTVRFIVGFSLIVTNVSIKAEKIREIQ